ncbi:ECF-type riboflavin transporter substrate-binding protein [Lachnospiraceae bacterium OttesenSCG-928-D06]|nr:ECF-type riboflavin transporter substrate-binding protein [Lachnospiraceae bacterium OttesenSCG-928-D06]
MQSQKFGVKTVVAIGIGSATYFLLARFASVPIFANTTLAFQYAVLGFFAAVFGPVAGLLIALIGHILTDLTSYGLWWSWIVTSGVVGLASGIVMKGNQVEEGDFGRKSIIKFTMSSILIHAVAWIGIAPTLDVLIYKEPVAKTYLQGVTAGLTNGVITAIIGSFLLIAYSKTRVKAGSLTKD